MGWPQPQHPLPPPAYNAVTVGQPVLMRPTPVQEQAPQPLPRRKVEWSPAVREYVQRSFDPENAIPGVQTSEMQDKLKHIISYYAERDLLNQVDWATHQLPQTLIIEDRQKDIMQGWSSNGRMVGQSHTQTNASNGTGNDTTPRSSKKRKSNGVEDPQTHQNGETLPPWKKANRNMLEDRMTFTKEETSEKRQKKNGIFKGAVSSKFSESELEKRKQRFQASKPGNRISPTRIDTEPEVEQGPVIGTNMSLEKNYFRLTAPPKPETVRPQHILEKTLEFLKRKWKAEKNYGYICDQFKSLRQDLTVQHIKNSFTVTAYEIHARIALEKGDTGEYNQCQTQLKALYAQKLGGHPEEFLGYRILYYVYTCNKTDMNDLLAELTPVEKKQAAVKHALDVRSALALGNYHKFFRLYLSAPYMGAYLMDMFIERERLAALANMSRAYFNVNIRYLTDGLGFDSDADCFEFFESHNAQHLVESTDDQTRVNLKEAKGLFENLRAAAFKKVDIKGQI